MNTDTEKTSLPNIGVIVPGTFIPPTNGGQRVCYDFCIALSKKTNLLCFSPQRERSLHGLELFPLYSGSCLRYFDITLVVRLARQLKQHKATFCIVNQPFLVGLAYLACKLAQCRVITYAHNLEFKRSDGVRRYLKPFIFLLETAAFHLSHRVFFISYLELSEAKRYFRLAADRCVLVPHIAHHASRFSSKKVTDSEPFSIIFFGNFAYPPNLRALDDLINHVVPALIRTLTFPCRLVVFGSSVPIHLRSLSIDNNLSIEILGYIDNPTETIARADVMLNPVCHGAGVQTKIIEALSLGTTVLSATSGARGINLEIVKDKLLLVEDRDWDGFANAICNIYKTANNTTKTPASFYDEYSEESMLKRVMPVLQDSTTQRGE